MPPAHRTRCAARHEKPAVTREHEPRSEVITALHRRLLAEDGINLTADELVALTEFIEELEGDGSGYASLEMLAPLREAA